MKFKHFFMANKKKITFGVFILLALWACVYFYNQTQETLPATTDNEKVFPVKVLNVESTEGDVYLTYAGMIQPNELEQATASTVATVTKMYVKEGDKVTKGQVLFTLEDEDAKNRQNTAYQTMKAAEAGMNSSKTALDASQKAYDESYKAPSAEEINKANQELADAKTQQASCQSEIDRINNLTKPQQESATSAQNNLTQKQQEFDIAYEKANSETATDDDRLALELATQNVVTAQEQLNTANAQLLKAENDLDKQGKLSQLNAANTRVNVAQAEVDRLANQSNSGNEVLKTQLETAKFNYESSKATYEGAKSNYESATQNLENYTYKAKNNGSVVKVVTSEGDMATPIAPVLVIGTDTITAQFGVSQADVRSVEEGMRAKVTVNGNDYNGKITKIDLIPDTTSRTYLTTVTLSNIPKDLYLGEIATVKIDLGSKTGVWLPLSVIMNDGTDYVYVVEDDRAARRDIEIQDIDNDNVRITGVSSGEVIIKEGMKTVKNGQLVNVVSEG